jgi:hypothetical protein
MAPSCLGVDSGKWGLSPITARRLQALLNAQHQRMLTAREQEEAATLVEHEDFMTLRRAKALFLLKQRGALAENPPRCHP